METEVLVVWSLAWRPKGLAWGHEKNQNYHSELDNGRYPGPLVEVLKPYRIRPICPTSHLSCSLLPINVLATVNWSYITCGVSSRWYLYPWPHLTSLEGDFFISVIWMRKQVHRYSTTWPWPQSHQRQGEDSALGFLKARQYFLGLLATLSCIHTVFFWLHPLITLVLSLSPLLSLSFLPHPLSHPSLPKLSLFTTLPFCKVSSWTFIE